MKSKNVPAYLDSLPLEFQGPQFIRIITAAVEIAEAEMEKERASLEADIALYHTALTEANKRLEISAKVIADKNMGK